MWNTTVMNTQSSTEDSWSAEACFGKHIPSFFLAQLAPGSALQPRPSIPLPRGTPAPHLSWSPLSTCTAVGAGLNHGLAIMGLTLNWFAQEQTAREQQLPEEAGCAPATHSQDTRLQDLSVPGEAVTKGRPLCPAFLHDFRGATCFY